MSEVALTEKHERSVISGSLEDFEARKKESSIRFAYATWWLAIGLVVFVLWAAFFEIEKSVRAQGQVIPSARTQVVQVADGGVVAGIFVNEGDMVEEGQLLAMLERERSESAYEEVRALIASLEATRYRLQAVVNDTPLFFGDELQDYPDLVAAETSLYQQRKNALEDELSVMEEAMDMATQELDMQESLLSTGDTSQLEVMRARRQVSDVRGNILSLRNEYYSEARQEMARVEAEIAQQRHQLVERRDVLDHAEIRSPVAGSVKFLKVNTLGGVLRAGDELMQISPMGGDIMLEVRIDPRDVAELEVGLPVSIKFDAFDYPIYGDLEGTLEYISADTLTEESGEESMTYYRAHLRISEDQDNPRLSSEMLRQGMTVSVDIQTGTRTVLEFIAKPIVRAFDGALTQR